MRKLRFFLPFAALGLLASCSNDNMGEPTPPQAPEANGEGLYASFNIGLSDITRAVDGYDAGEADEHDVYNVVLYLFKASEADLTANPPEEAAKYIGSVELFNIGWDDTNQPEDITKSRSYVGKLPGVTKEGTDSFYGFVVINDKGNYKPFDTDGKFNPWNINQDNYISADGFDKTNIGMIPEIEGTRYFTMANAPQVLDSKASTLVLIDKSQFVTLPAEPTNPAATFYVQRGVAKVKVGVDNGESKNSSTTGLEHVAVKDKDDYVIIKNWSLDITNTKSFPVQNVSGFDTWTGTHFSFGTTMQRVAWAVDPNYGETGSFNVLESLDDFTGDAENTLAKKFMYCLENTAAPTQMAKDRVTRVVFKAEYVFEDQSEAKPFIVYPENGKAMPIEETDLIEGFSLTSGTYTYEIDKLVKAAKLEDVATKLGLFGPTAKVQYFPEGVTYYTAYIRHFDDQEVRSLEDVTIDALGKYTNEDLGRYGVVRNNSYEVNVRQVLGYGSPEIPTPTPDPVDQPDPEKWTMSVAVKILSWAKRSNAYDPK